MSFLIGRRGHKTESYPGAPSGGSAAAAIANLELIAAILDNNVQNIGPVSTPGTTVFFDSGPFTLLPSPVPGNATIDIKASMSVSGTAGDIVTWTLVRDRATTPIVLATQQSAISPSTGLSSSETMAYLDTNVGVQGAGITPLVEGSTHTYSIVATSAAALTGTEPASVIMEQLPSGSTTTITGAGTGPVALNSLANFAGFAGAGISITAGVGITGSIGLGPGVTSTAFTGFGQTLPAGAPEFNQYATSPLVLPSTQATAAPYNVGGGPPSGYVTPPANQGVLYAADYAVPTPANVNTSNNDMLAAYTDASSRPVPGANLNVGGGTLAGQGLTPGVYKWTTPVTLDNGVLTLTGGAGTVFILIMTGTFSMAGAAQSIALAGGVTPATVFFAIAGAVTIGPGSAAEGTFLAKTNIAMSGATLLGRAFAQTGLTLSDSAIVEA